MTKKPNDSCLRLLLGMTGLLITSSNGGTLAHGTDRVRYATVQINKISRRFKLRHYPTAPTLRLQRPLFRHTAREPSRGGIQRWYTMRATKHKARFCQKARGVRQNVRCLR